VFHESVTKEELLNWIQIPLNKERLIGSAVVEHQKLDSFLTRKALRNWPEQIRNYESFKWEKIDPVNFHIVQTKEIPRYIREGGLLKPNEESNIVEVLYLSKPFVYSDKAIYM
jgi:hypothetical protein